MQLSSPKNKKIQKETFPAQKIKKSTLKKFLTFRQIELSSSKLKKTLMFQEGACKAQKNKNFLHFFLFFNSF